MIWGALAAIIIANEKNLPYLEIHAIDNNTIRIFFARLKSKILRRKILLFRNKISSKPIYVMLMWYTHICDVASDSERRWSGAISFVQKFLLK